MTDIESLVRDLQNLGGHLKKTRIERGLSLRKCADEIGVPDGAIPRIEKGGDVMFSTALRILLWLHNQPPFEIPATLLPKAERQPPNFMCRYCGMNSWRLGRCENVECESA